MKLGNGQTVKTSLVSIYLKKMKIIASQKALKKMNTSM